MENNKKLNAFYKTCKTLLTTLYFERYDELNYENVDEFYAYLGYDLELVSFVETFIRSTSNLLELIKKEVEGE